jgi:hypothetical protein
MTIAALAIVEAIEGISTKKSADSDQIPSLSTYTFRLYFLPHYFRMIDSR